MSRVLWVWREKLCPHIEVFHPCSCYYNYFRVSTLDKGSKNLEDVDFGKVGSTERFTPARSWWWMRRRKEIYAYLTRTESSAGYFLHWHSLTKGSTIERSWVGAGPGPFLPSSPTGNIAGWPLCPGRPASIHWERKMGRGEEKKKKERGFYWLPTMCKPLARCCELGIQGPRDQWGPSLAAPLCGNCGADLVSTSQSTLL